MLPPPPAPPSLPCHKSLLFLWSFQLTSFAVVYSIGSVLSLSRCRSAVPRGTGTAGGRACGSHPPQQLV